MTFCHVYSTRNDFTMFISHLLPFLLFAVLSCICSSFVVVVVNLLNLH